MAIGDKLTASRPTSPIAADFLAVDETSGVVDLSSREDRVVQAFQITPEGTLTIVGEWATDMNAPRNFLALPHGEMYRVYVFEQLDNVTSITVTSSLLDREIGRFANRHGFGSSLGRRGPLTKWIGRLN